MRVYAEQGLHGSAVHVVRDEGGDLVCYGCHIAGGLSFHTHDHEAMLDHLDFHTLVRHHVPSAVFVALRDDRDGEDLP